VKVDQQPAGRGEPRLAPVGDSTMFIDQPVWVIGAWGLLGSLLVWSYGINNVPIPGVSAPLVDLVFVVLLARSRRYWRPFLHDRLGHRIIRLLIWLSAFVFVRAVVDYRTYGLQAIRDSLFAVEAWAILLGWGLARRVGRRAVERSLSVLFAVSIGWFCLYPVRDSILSVSPIVGVQKAVPLVSFVSIGFVGAWALLWFIRRPGRLSIGASIVAIGVVFMAQTRGVFAGLALAALAALAVTHDTQKGRAVRRILIASALVLSLFAVLPPLPGRLGTVSPATIVNLVESGVGAKTTVSSSLDDREKWFDATVNAIKSTRFALVTGVGLGRDLTGGFATTVQVTRPHNDFLEYFARLGTIGFLPWLGLWFFTVRELVVLARRRIPIAVWGVGAASVSLLVSLTQPLAAFAYGGLVHWMLMGLVLGAATESIESRAENSKM
jgi:O-Antigen ligase